MRWKHYRQVAGLLFRLLSLPVCAGSASAAEHDYENVKTSEAEEEFASDLLSPDDFDRIVRDFGPCLYRAMIARRGWSHEDAEDHVQKVFLQMLISDYPFSGLDGLRTWLRVTSQRLATDEYRRRHAIRHGGRLHRSPFRDFCEERRGETAADKAELEESLQVFRDRLSFDCAEIITLKLEGMSNQIIARRLGLRPRSVQRRLGRAWKVFCEVLHGYGSENIPNIPKP